MRKLFRQTLIVMENIFEFLEEHVPPPVLVKWGDKKLVYRYKEKTIEQALVLKLARIISGLYAVDVLLINGLLQEQAALHRILDEINEDILFLALAITDGDMTAKHKQYLDAFYAEAFSNPNDSLARSSKPNSVSRKKIRSYNHISSKININPSLDSDLGETISAVYSGFIHASSPQIMDMYGGNPPRFHVANMLGTPRMAEHVDDAWNYFYRGLLSFVAVAKAFGDQTLVDVLFQHIDKFEVESGTDYMKAAKA